MCVLEVTKLFLVEMEAHLICLPVFNRCILEVTKLFLVEIEVIWSVCQFSMSVLEV